MGRGRSGQHPTQCHVVRITVIKIVIILSKYQIKTREIEVRILDEILPHPPQGNLFTPDYASESCKCWRVTAPFGKKRERSRRTMLYLYLAASSRRLGQDGGAVAGGGRGHDQSHVVDLVLADEVRLLSSEVLKRRE